MCRRALAVSVVGLISSWISSAYADVSPVAPAPAEVDAGPPARPPRRGVVLESSVGALAFFGDFRHVAPPGLWLHTQLGYEPFAWLMLFGEGELAFTNTSTSQPPSHARAFPIFGFGVGARGTVRWSERWSTYVQLSIDALKADVPRNALTILGYSNAEDFGAALGGRAGLEWYQSNSHIALGLAVGARYASSFAKTVGNSGPPIAGDAALTLRYTF